MELREFYEFDLWPPDSGRREAVQLVVREVGALVAVRRSVADVDWIQPTQSCISAALVRSAAQAEPTVISGGANDDGDERQLTDGVANAASDRSGARLADAMSTISSTIDCEKLEHAVARWRAGLARAAQQQSPQLTKREGN